MEVFTYSLRLIRANAKKEKKYGGNNLDIHKIQNGDNVEFTKMYDVYFKYVYSYVYRKLKNKHDAEEIVQDIFTDVWSRKSTIKSHSIVWTIAKRKCIDFFRKKRVCYFDCLLLEEGVAAQDDWQEEKTLLLEKLSHKEKQIVGLLLHGYKRDEVAVMLNIALGTVDSRLHRLKKKLAT